MDISSSFMASVDYSFSDTINCLSIEKSFCESRMKIWMFFEDFIDRNMNKIRIKMNFSKKERNNKFSMII